ncbi:MAG: T9SS type A sorting domain-containing protein [bacterium]|nr:T9SS type A sorting domain-containing protein [bacterium]
MHSRKPSHHHLNSCRHILALIGIICLLLPRITLEAIADETTIGAENLNGLHYNPEDPTIGLMDRGALLSDYEPSRMDLEQALREAAENPDRDWTVMFYDDADFTYAFDPLDNLTEMAFSSENIDFIVLQDTSYGPAFLWHIESDGTRTLLAELGEVDMGHYTTLRDLLQYGRDNYPAERYMLCLYDHGGGHAGACIDVSSEGTTMLSMDDFKRAITETGGLDIIAFTGPCLMGAVESVYELRDCVDVYVGSEDLSGYALWMDIFDDICICLDDSDLLTNEDIGTHLVDLVEDNISTDLCKTLCAARSETVEALALLIDELVVYLTADMAFHYDSIRQARQLCKVLAGGVINDFNRVDLWTVFNKLRFASYDPFVDTMCDAILTAFDEVVFAEWNLPGEAGYYGLSLFFPRTVEAYFPSYHSYSLDFAADTGWDEFLRTYFYGDLTAAGEFTDPTGFLSQCNPNPFRNETSISFTNSRPGPVSIQIYDIMGRHVRALCNSILDSGVQNLVWDGHDSNGHSVPSGTYLYRIDANDTTETRRMVLIR